MKYLAKTIESAFSGKLIWFAFLSLLIAVLIIGLFSFVAGFLANQLFDFGIPWLSGGLAAVIGIATGIGGWFMIPALTRLMGAAFMEPVIDCVERESYPSAVRKTAPRILPDVMHDIRFVMYAVFLNLLISPLYLIGIGFFASVALNTHLLGREFFETAAGYHIGKPAAEKLLSRHRMKVYTGGFLITIATLVPILNLFAPLLGVVYMVHLYHDVRFA